MYLSNFINKKYARLASGAKVLIYIGEFKEIYYAKLYCLESNQLGSRQKESVYWTVATILLCWALKPTNIMYATVVAYIKLLL